MSGPACCATKHATALDKLIAGIQCCLVEQATCFEDGKIVLLAELHKLAVNIQAVRQKDALIAEVRSADFWLQPGIDKLENARKELRGIHEVPANRQHGRLRHAQHPYRRRRRASE